MLPSAGVSASSVLSRLRSFKLPNPFRRPGGYLVLDIGSSSLKLAEVYHGSGGPQVVALGVAPLPPTSVQSNVVQDEGAVAETIRGLVTATGAQAKQVVTAVPGPAVIVKKVILQSQPGSAVESAVLAEAGHLIPDSLENVNLDYQVTDWIEAGNKMEVLVVAVKKDIINSYTNTIRAADLEPVVVDVDYFALENMFELNYDPPAEGRPVALVNIGARYSSINILKDGRSTFTGDVPVGGAEYADALTRQLGVSPHDAEILKLGKAAGKVDPATAEPVLGSVTEFIVEEIQRALSFFWTAATDEPLGAVFLSGGSARMPGLTTTLKQRLECPVEVADPFRRVSIGSRVDRELVDTHGPALAVAVGLATRRPGDK
ncbi:MAG TPA: type IV pilus assembly protein PilM [Candidatus Binatia bacterium]|nr:type IV pilus assembly protein PilM [Candidatus Binatia bacterium]